MKLAKHLSLKKSLFFQAIIWVLAFSLMLTQIMYTRFLQDDYYLLGAISDSSLFEFLKGVWQGQGGNLWIYAFQGLLLLPSLHSVDTSIIAAWTIVTISVVSLTNYLVIKWFMGGDLRLLGKYRWLSIFSISYLGYEGLFTPGLIAAFSYHQAAFSHLWPIMLLIIALSLFINKNTNLLLAFTLGVFIGNSNISESFSAGFFLLIILFFRKKSLIIKNAFTTSGYKFYCSLLSGNFIGFLIILIAPGFWNRAQNSVGFPNSVQDLLYRFFKSFGSFSADLATHPMVWLAFLIGVMVAIPEKFGQDKIVLVSRIKLLACLGFILFITLTFGSTFAYVSWHQSTGLYQIFIPLTFVLGVFSKSIIKFERKRSLNSLLAFVVTASLILISARAGIAFKARAADWDNAFEINYCLIKENPNSKLVGAEMLYPGFNLGIEDVSNWEWMRNGYSRWVSNPKFKDDANC
jgi:hypothetical protein